MRSRGPNSLAFRRTRNMDEKDVHTKQAGEGSGLCDLTVGWLLALSGPEFTCQISAPPLPSAHLAHQPQRVFGVLSSLFQVLDGFLHDMGLTGGEVHPAFQHVALGGEQGERSESSAACTQAHTPLSTISTLVGLTSRRSQQATSSARWSLLRALPVTPCHPWPSKSGPTLLIRTG